MLFEHDILQLVFNNKANLSFDKQNELITKMFTKYNYKCSKQNSGKFGEYLFKEYLEHNNINYKYQQRYISNDKSIPSYIFDFVIDDNVAIEIKTNLYNSPGTAYEKIYGVPYKYRYVNRYGINKLIIMLLLDNENKVMFNNDAETNEWLKYCERNNIEFKYFTHELINNIVDIKSPIKWAGCKQNSLQYIIKYINKIINDKQIDYYYEPFLGSGCVLINVIKQYNNIFKHYYVSDTNAFIVKMFYLIEHDVNKLIDNLQFYIDEYNTNTMDKNKELYNTYRNKLNEYIITNKYNVNAIVLFMFINKVCYHGLYRVNSNGLFNVPFGNYKTITYNYDNLRRISILLNFANIHYAITNYVNAFEHITRLRDNVLLYLDPPYHDTFNDYSKQGFDTNDFIDKLTTIKTSYLNILLSNSLSFINIYKNITNNKIDYEVIDVLNKINNNRDVRKEVLIMMC